MLKKSCILSVMLALGFVLCLTNGFADERAEFAEALRVAEEMKSAAIADRPGDIQGTPEFPKVPENSIGTDATAPSAQMYWTDTSKIQRADLSGANVEDLVTTGLLLPGGVAVDMTGGKMYWTDWGLDAIYRANLDGSNVEPLVTRLNNSPWGIALDAAAGKMYWTMGPISGDREHEIRSANLDGTNVQTLVTGLQQARYLALDVTGGKMYWTIAAPGASVIQRANLNGTNVENLVTTGLRLPGGIAVDTAAGKMYWTDWVSDAIYRANLDGSNVEPLVTGLNNPPWGIAVDGAGGKMYWTLGPISGDREDEIRRANLDGSDAQILITGLDRARYIVLGIQQTSGTITFSPSEIADQTFTVGTDVSLALPVATGGTAPYIYTLKPKPPEGLAFDSSAERRSLHGTPTAPMPATLYTYTATDADGTSAALTFTLEVLEEGIPADALDVNGDGQVTVIDLVLVALFYGTEVPDGGSLAADVNADGIVNILDLTAVAHGIDTQDGTDGLSLAEVAAALAAAELEAIAEAPNALSVGNRAYHNVAAALADARLDKRIPETVLKVLLHLLSESVAIPETTALLPNYPNPFNPETWIPYHLATDAAVVLTIYDVHGRVVRVLDFGHQRAGIYQSRGRAAYWDGRNQIGESVASGVYFYTLTAGDFNATRKLLIAK